MEIKEYENYLIRQDGLVLNSKTNKIINGHVNTYGDVTINSGTRTEKIKNIVARLFFDFDINFQRRIKISHLDFNKLNNSVDNLKIYLPEDKFNVSGKNIVFFGGEFVLLNKSKIVSTHYDLRTAFNKLTELCQQ